MKKVLSYILISLILFANLFAPFSVGFDNKNNIKINLNKASAAVDDWSYVRQARGVDYPSPQTSYELCKSNRDADIIKYPAITGTNFTICSSASGQVAPGGTAIPTADPNATDYYFTTTVAGAAPIDSNPTTLAQCNTERAAMEAKVVPNGSGTVSQCNSKQVIQQVLNNVQTEQNKDVSSDKMPSCGVITGTIAGCAAQIIYYVLFIPTSYLFALAGVFFDNTFAYSVQDTSYTSSFVVQGWGLVRDFCNMFFIFVMLYVAIGTILSLHSMKTKETIVNVVIIGLFINFSLFATQVIIDASNVMARVFYNSDSIKITEKGANGVANKTPGLKVDESGVLPLSAALVNKVNPQNIIIHSEKVGQIKDSAGKTTDASSLSAGTFILLTLLAVGVNLIGIVVFASVGLIFVARVIGLWIAMIMAPLAFFTYILPEMSSWKMVGWKNWWPDTLKLAFLAPVFIFFLYIILKFLELDLISDPLSKDGLSFLIATIIPFAFIMILLMKAKSIASDMSGEIGQQITSKLSMAGGLALGAATGGAALLGRNVIGRYANKTANNQELIDKAAAGDKVAKAKLSMARGLSKSSFDFRQTAAGSAFSKETGMNLNTGTKYLGLDSKKTAGGFVAQQQRKLEKENKFADSLGYDHHKYEDAGAEIGAKEANLAAYKASSANDNSPKYRQEVARKEKEIADAKKDQERIKTARKNEYILSNKRKSGKIYGIDKADKNQAEYNEYRESIKEEDVKKLEDEYNGEADITKKAAIKTKYDKAFNAYAEKNEILEKKNNVSTRETAMRDSERRYNEASTPEDKKRAQEEYEKAQTEHSNSQKEYEDTVKRNEFKNDYRDANGNIKKFGHAEKDAAQATKQILKEFAAGVAKGAGTGALAGSILPGVGTIAGAVGGGLVGGIRELMHYSGTTNQKVGADHGHSENFQDKYQAPSGGGHTAPAAKHDAGGGDHGHDDHGAAKH